MHKDEVTFGNYCRLARHILGAATLRLTDIINTGLFNYAVCVYVSSSSFHHVSNKMFL
jgi:hypothetical protein